MPLGERAMAMRPMREDWETPASIFDPLNAEFRFTLDAAASSENAKCAHYFTAATDGLAFPWMGMVWLNPPYGHKNLARWMRKAWQESQEPNGPTVVCLVPAHTGQACWHDWVWGKAAEIRWIRGKVKFVGAASCAPFPSCIVIYRPGVTP